VSQLMCSAPVCSRINKVPLPFGTSVQVIVIGSGFGRFEPLYL
jgi:hypothetical protein